MANRLKLLIDFLAYTSASPTNRPSDDSTAIKSLVEESSFTELCRKQVAVPTATSDLTLTLADSSSDYLLIFCDQTVTIKLNGSSDNITLTPKVSGTKTLVFMVKGTISALTVSNASGSTANLDVVSVNL